MVRKALIASVVTVGVVGVGGFALLPAYADDGRHGFGRGGREHSAWLMLIPIGLALVAAGLIAWLLLRRRSAGAGGTAAPALASTTAGAEAILAERLARGEIAPDEYHHLLAVLRAPAAGHGEVTGAAPEAEPPAEATVSE